MDTMLISPQEKKRQKHFINLIPSENFTSQAVLDALGSVMQSQSDTVNMQWIDIFADRK